MNTKEDIQNYRKIIAGEAVPLKESTKRTAATKPRSIRLSEYVKKSIPKYFNLASFCADHSTLMTETKNMSALATALIARRIAEGFDMSEYVKRDAADYYSHLARNISRSMLHENKQIKASILTEGLPNHDTSWLMKATEEVRRRCQSGEDCDEVINDLAREYSETEGGHHEAFEMARDALSKRAWEMDLGDKETPNITTADEFDRANIDDYMI